MSSVRPSEDAAARRRHRKLANAVKDALRELNSALSVFNRHVGGQVALKDVDYDCLELLNRFGPLTPGVLARRAGLHPATMTGVLDRLQRGGWVVRERDPAAVDRRAVLVRPLRARNAELYQHLAGMNASMDQLCAGYSDEELELITDFLRRTAAAGRDAANDLTDS
ncbi:MarR family transcriptional regulator [Actinopolymorpha singaporensis]|uniref:DNA-binding transcriptional regulator, MarR family n=1 Tax=Actinopolymorpha singaporensis TaxID=117157 RepID=A0A1H1SS00_9ACTN|nr:MarR family transcriptional regulator [Actinopolymorpha singaporensis]SDS50705.1 DNA-binding transcriptional regulator, MarR family [Actinopolymorpha singaporensis]